MGGLWSKGNLGFLASSVAAPVLGLLGGLITARFVAPNDLGKLQSVMLVGSYLTFLHLGAFNGMNLCIPLSLGRNDACLAQTYLNSARTFSLLLAALGALVALGLALARWHAGRGALDACAFVALAVVLAGSPLITWHDAAYRSYQSFGRLAAVTTVVNCAGFALSFLAAVLGPFGVAIRMAAQPAINLAALWKGCPVSATGWGKASYVITLVRTGFPLMLVSLISSYLMLADRTLVVWRLGPDALGTYALATMVATVIGVVPGIVGGLLYPRAASEYGRCGTPSALRKFVWQGLAANALVVLPIVLGGWIVLPPAVKLLLPKYVPGIPAAQVALLAAVPMVYAGPSVVIAVLQRTGPLMVFMGLGMTLTWGMGFVLIEAGFGLVGAAAAKVAGLLVVGLLTVWHTLKVTR
jgi:O-antigen/teichoic acid export membrane protein